MSRSGIVFQITPAHGRLGNYILRITTVTHADDGDVDSVTTLHTRIYAAQELGDTDPLEWAEHLCDEIYKTINQTRADRLGVGWVSGSGGQAPRASENPSPEM